MRILVWSSYYFPRVGGTEFFLTHLLDGLLARGHTAEVISFQADPPLPEREVIRGVPIHRFPIPQVLASRDLGRIRALQKRLADRVLAFGPDVYHLNNGDGLLYFYERISHRHPLPTLLTLHSDRPFLAGPNSLAGRTLLGATRIVAVSDFVRGAVLRAHPAAIGRTTRIYNGCPPPDREPTVLPVDPPRLLALGRFIPEKGFDVLLRGFAEVYPAFPKARLVLVGDGPAYPGLVQLSGALGLELAVNFTGYLDQNRIMDHMRQASFVVVPSLWQEPFGYAALQAMQLGRPVLASRTGGLPEIIDDAVTGLLVPPGNPGALADAFRELLQDPERLTAMGEQALTRIRGRFSYAGFVADYETEFLSCLA